MADPLTFVFLLTVWTADSPAPLVYVEDAGISGQDCIERVADYVAADPTWSRGNPSCEPDTGELVESLSVAYAVEIEGATQVLYPCQFEDSQNCVWDARWRGDGEGTGLGTGQSFADFAGVIYNIEFGEFDEIVSISRR